MTSEDTTAMPSSSDDILLEVTDLRTHFFTREGVVQAVDGIDLYVRKGEILAVVGESGCGKSVTSLSILGLIPHPGRVVSGSVKFAGREVTEMSKRELSDLRGEHISMVFQQPTSALNPVFRAGRQIAEMYELHRDMKENVRQERAIEMLAKVGIPDPGRRALAYPHELSGGMAQRVMIAIALACEPELLIADEPTTALDVTIQAQILDLMRDLQRDFGSAVILITHDLGVVAEMADRVAVMYAGKIVEEGDVDTIFDDPKHPYTQGLIGSIPVLGERKESLDTIPGIVPSLIDPPVGCRFADRCKARVEHGLERCTVEEPPLITVGAGHTARCWLYDEEGGDV